VLKRTANLNSNNDSGAAALRVVYEFIRKYRARRENYRVVLLSYLYRY
jgi:hypothetical protein